MGGQPGAEPAGDEFDHRRVGDDETLAGGGVAFALVAAPEVAQLDLLYPGFHGPSEWKVYGRLANSWRQARGWVDAYASRRRAASTLV